MAFSERVHRLLAATDPMSQNQVRDLLDKALCDMMGEGCCCWIVDIYPDNFIYERDCSYFQMPYTVDGDGKVTLGTPTEVQREIQYMPMKAAAIFLSATDAGGTVYRARIVQFGPDKNGTYWDEIALKAALHLFDGAKVFALNDSQHKEKPGRFGKSPRELVAALARPTAEKDGIYADVVILPSAVWLSGDLKACKEHGIPLVYGLSVDINASTTKKTVGGRTLIAPKEIKGVQVDVVYDPAAGGEFLEQLAAAVGQEEEGNMLKKLLAALKSKRPDLHTQISKGMEDGSITDDKALEMIVAATVPGEAGGDTATIVAAVVAGLKDLAGQCEGEALQEVKIMACGVALDRELTASKLPDKWTNSIRSRFEGKVFETSELQAAIKDAKELLDDATGSGSVHGAGSIRASVGRETVDKFQAAVDGMLGVRVPEAMRDVPVFRSIRAAYVEMTGDTDITGVLDPTRQRRLQAAYGDATFAYALGNTLYRRMVQDYRELPDYGVSRLVGPNIRNAVDFRALESIRIGYYGDLPLVDTDTDDYPDLGEVGDEKIEHALKERGGIITINRRMIINDDVRAIQRIISRLPRAARRTVARTVWAPFTTNAAYKGDNKAIFHTDHANLGSTAYAIATAEAAKTAMFRQTEPGSGEILGLRPVTVAFPSELRALVTNVNTFAPQAVAVENGNSMFGFFKPEGLFENPFQTDTNNWYFFADPNEVEIVELAFLNGQQEPLMVVADNPAVGQMFVGGKIQYRITHDHSAEVTDYRGAYGAIVA